MAGTKDSQFCQLRQYLPELVQALVDTKQQIEARNPGVRVRIQRVTVNLSQGFRVTNDDAQDLRSILCSTGQGPLLTLPFDLIYLEG